MPTYKFLNSDTNEEYTEFMSISALDQYLADRPTIKQLVNGAPMISTGSGFNKPDDGFRDLLKEIKKNNSRGTSQSTIQTF